MAESDPKKVLTPVVGFNKIDEKLKAYEIAQDLQKVSWSLMLNLTRSPPY